MVFGLDIHLDYSYSPGVPQGDRRVLKRHTSTSNGGFDQAVQFLITADGQLKVTGRDTLHLEVLAGITSQL